jgi:hypothetical protein
MAERRWKKNPPKWPWHDFLTDEERQIIAEADKAKRVWQQLMQTRTVIINRAIHRAKYHARKRQPSSRAEL